MADTVDSGNAQGDGDGQYAGPRAHDPAPPDDHRDDPGYVTRTKFLSGVALATGGVMGAAIIVPVVGFAVVDPLKEEDFRWVDAGPASELIKNPPPYVSTDGSEPVVGGDTSIAVSGPDPESDRRVFVVLTRKLTASKKSAVTLQASDMDLLAIWNRCAHLGCPVGGSGGVYSCPCHGGAYDARGLVTAGPPPRPLDRFDVKISDGKRDVPLTEALDALGGGGGTDLRVLIGKPYSIDSKERPYAISLPGQPVDGILSNLYPF